MIGFPLSLPLEATSARKISVIRLHDGRMQAVIELHSNAEHAAMAAFADGQPVAVPVPRRPITFTPRPTQGGAA